MAEGGGLLNRYTLQRRIEGSNPSVSARFRASESVFGAAGQCCPESKSVDWPRSAVGDSRIDPGDTERLFLRQILRKVAERVFP